MSTSTIRLSTNPTKAGQNHRHNLLTPQTCETPSLKVQNIRRDIASLESRAAEMLGSLDDLERYNMTILVAGLVKDSCVGFLDLASELLPPGPAKKFAKGGLAAIEYADTGARLYHGQITKSQAATKAARTTAGLVPSGEKTLGATVDLAKDAFYGGAETMATGKSGTKKAQDEASLAYVQDISLSTVAVIASGIEEELTGDVKVVGPAKSAIKTVKSVVERYDTFSQEAARLKKSRKSWERMLSNEMATYQRMLENALKELEGCWQEAAPEPEVAPLA